MVAEMYLNLPQLRFDSAKLINKTKVCEKSFFLNSATSEKLSMQVTARKVKQQGISYDIDSERLNGIASIIAEHWITL